MIAIVANPSERPVVAEFFELFKTPWEFYRDGRSYEVLVRAGDSQVEDNAAKLVLTYAGRPLSGECQENVLVTPQSGHARILSCRGKRIPIYGDCVTFPQKGTGFLVDEETRQPAAYLNVENGSLRARIGYDLFGEVRALLTKGQPVEHAGIPTLDLHIALLRDLILANGIPLVEIPPLPDVYPFIVCLTHDVDHPSIRRHKFDHTMFGFLYRAIFRSMVDVAKGRASVPDLLRNWGAALKLPLVHLGLTTDFWHRFQDYPRIEKGLPSTFYVIPFKGRPGRSHKGRAPHRRAAAYGAADIAGQIRNLMTAGCEIGLHGIDAWCDTLSGRQELKEIQRISGVQEVGVRMHWLYFDEQSHAKLERAGATYDSTVGYNDAVGYRAGTAQTYKPLQASRLLELPLHLMDTALFFPGRLKLSTGEARKQVDNLVDHAGHFGGSITINWHDRSIAPERLWGKFYVELVDALNSKGAWFATAAQAVAWFKKRRSAVFESMRWEAGTLHVKVAVEEGDNMPALRLHIHQPRNSGQDILSGAAADEGDVILRLNSNIDVRIPIGSSSEESQPARTTAQGWVTTHVV